MDEKQLQFLFDQYGSKSGFSDFAEFKGLMADSSARKVFFDNSNKDLGFKDYGEFESLLGFKKKDGGPALPSSPSLELPSVSTEPPKRLTYTDINSSIEKLSKAQKDLRELESAPGFTPGGYSPNYAKVNNDAIAAANKNVAKAKADRDKVFSEYAGEISRPVDQLIESQDYTKFFTPSGNIDYAKAREHFQKVSQQFGGGPALVEHWVANLKMRGQGEIERKEVKPLFEQKLKELGLQKYADQEQYAKSVFDGVVQKNKNQLDLLIQDRDQRANSLLDKYKDRIDYYTRDMNAVSSALNDFVQSGEMSEQEAKEKYDAQKSFYDERILEVNKEYETEVSKINRQVKQKYGRINQELDAISKDKDFVMKSIPEADRKLIDKAYIDARAQRMKGKETVDRAVDEASGLSGLFARSVSSGFLSGIASIGDAMSSGGYSNKLVDWMQNKRTAAEELKPAEYTWSGDPLKRAITSSGQSLGASAPLLAPSIGLMAATGGSAAGVVGSALLSYYGENKQNAGQVYRDVLEQSGDVALARDQARDYFQKTAVTLPLYFVGSLGEKALVLGKGLKKAAAGLGLELAEEIPVEYIQSHAEAVTSQGYKGSLAQYIKENPELMLDIAVGTGVQAGAMKTVAAAFSKVASAAPAPQTQTLADAIMTQGREFAARLVQTQFDQGLINEQKRDELFQSIGTIEANLAKLDELGVRGDAAKLHMALSQEMAELQANRKAEKDESVQAVLDSKINDLKTQMTGVLTGQTEYIVFGMPGDVNSKTMLASTFNALSQQEKDDTIRSAKSVTVINNPQLNQQLQDQKQALGNPEGAPEGAYETDATVQSQIEQQAGPAEGGVQERPGVDGGQQEVGQGAGQQGQAPVTQPDTGDRVLGGQAEVDLAGELRGELRQDFQPIIDRAAQSLQAANVQFEVLDDAEFTARVGQSAEGAFMTVGKDGKILLNRQKMEQADPGVIIWHESAHPVMNIVRNTNKPLYDRMVTGLKQLAQKSPELQRAIEFGRQYGTKLREAGRGDAEAIALEDDESIVESIAMIAADDKLMASLPTSIKQTLIDFVNYVAKALGIKARVTNTASADFRRTAQQIATALKEGRDITEIVGAENVGEIDNRLSEGITDIDGNPVDPAAAQFKVSGFKALINGIEFKYLKDSDRYNQLKADGFITEDKKISDFSNVPAILHVPDHAFTGEMLKDGEVIVDGKGGVFYPLRFHDLGYFWASTKTAATGMAAKLNAMRAQSPDGKMRLVLLSAPEDKLMSSTAASAGMLDVLLSKAFDRRAKITKDQVFEAYRLGVQKLKQEALTKGQKGVKFSGKVEDFVKTLPTIAKSATVDAFKSKFRSWFAPDVSNFDQRKKLNSFVLDSIAEIVSDKDAAAQILEFLAESSGQKIKSTGGRLSKANLVSGFSKLFSEPMLKGVATTGDAYAVIELDADVEAVSSNEHESYPFALKSVDSNKKPVVHILQDRTSWSEFTVDPETGSVVTEDRQDNILPPSAGISNIVTLRPQAAPQLSIGGRKMSAAPDYKQRSNVASDNLVKIFQRNNTPLTKEEAIAIVDDLKDWTDWYDGLATYVEGIFGEYAQDVLSLLPLASQANNSAGTVSLAISNAERVYKGESPKGVAEYYGYVSKFLQGMGIESDKMSNFLRAISGNPDAIAVDMHVWSIIKGTDPNKKSVNPKDKAQFDAAKDFVNSVSEAMGIEPRGVQAALWAGNILRTGGKPDSYEQYFADHVNNKGLSERIESWRNNGYQPFTPARKQRQEATGVQLSIGNRQAIIDKAKADGTYLKAPNGQPTNLSEDQWTTVRTPEFKNWFGDWENDPANASKVVDENGEPMVVYHGSDKSFDTFMAGRAEGWGEGMYFASEESDTAEFGGIVYPVFLNIRNPINESNINKIGDDVVRTKVWEDESKRRRKWDEEEGVSELDYRDELEENVNLANKAWRELGYDGIMFFGSNNINGFEIVSFAPIQIKSATSNVGTFSTEDARIQFSIGGRQPVGRINWERSPEGKGDPSISSRNPIVTKAAQDLKDGKITNEEYRATVSENSPIRPITRFFEPATEQEVRAALSEDKSGKTNAPITDGTVVGLRLDIPAYQNKNTWVVSVHDGDTNAGNALSYRNVGAIRNVRFGVSAKGALGIATGKAKQTIGRMFGEWVNIPGQTMEQQGENAKRMVQDIVDNPDYVQVGMNPFRHSYFYDRNTDIGRPIVSADEVIQVGGLVYAKNPVYGNWTDESYAVKGLFDAAGAQVQFSAGPRAESRVEFKLVAFVLRKKAEGYTDQQIAVAINSALPSMAPQDIARLIQDPQQYLVDSFPGFTAAQHSNLYERAKIANIFRSAPQRNIHPFFRSLRVDPNVVKQYYERTKTKREMANAWAKSLFNKNIRPSRGLENWMIQVKEFAKGAMNLEVANAKKTIDQLESTAKEIGFDNWDLFREAMSDAGMVAGTSQLALSSPIPASITRLPLEIQPYVTMMRDQIDGLTSRLIGLGYVTPEQAITLQNNVGQYVNRAYRLFSESGYQPDPKVKNAAIDFLTNQEYARLVQEFYDKNTTPATGQTSISGGPTAVGLANIPYDQLMEQAAKNAAVQVERILNKKANPYFGDAKVESRSIGVLKQRKEIPVEIRRLMGEYTDPGVVFMMTVVKQSALLASSQYLKDLRTRGMGTVFFEANDPNIPPTHSVQMASEGSSVLEPLNGLYTTPEIAEALNYIEPTYNMGAQIWMKMVGMVRMGKTVLSPVTQIINFIGNFGFAVMNGLIFTKDGRPFGAAMGEAWRYARGQYKTKQDFNEVTKKAIKLGIVGQSVDANSISEAFSSGDLFDVALDVALTGNGIFKTVKKNRIRPVAFFENLYRMGDDFWKIYAYISEREAYSSAKYKKKYADLTPEEQDIVDAQASERVKNTWPTFSRMFPIVRTLNKTIPLLGDFTGFQGESIRTPINTVLLALEDLKDPDLQASGARRLAAITAYIGIQTAVTAAIPIMLGYGAKGLIGKLINDDDEEEKKWALDEACPPHMYHHDKVAVPSEKSPHILTVISMNANNPINWTQLAVNAYFDGTSDMSAGALAAVFEIGSRFLGLGMTTEAVFDVQYNTKSQNGKPIYIGGKASEGGDDDGTKFMKGLDYVWNKLQPSAVKLYDRWSTTNNPGMEGAAAFGFRTYEIDLHKSFSVHLSRASKTLTDIDGELKNVTMFDKKATEEMKKEAIDEANEKKMAVVQNLNRLYRAYIKLGADPKVMRQTVAKKSAVKLTGMDDKTKAGILNGDIKPNFY